MKYLFVYYSSGQSLSPEEQERNREAWRTWNAGLQETYGMHTALGGKVVTADKSTSDYGGDLRGVSIVDANSMKEAVEKAARSPSVVFGGRVEVFAEFEP